MKKTLHFIKIKPAILLAGGRTALADMAGVTRMTVWSWEQDTGLIPNRYTSKVKRALTSRKRRLDRAYGRVMK